MSKRKVVGLSVVGVLLAIQLVPIDRSNPPVRGEIEVTEAVSEVLRRSCYDCHSNETQWPWYSYVAPASWILAHHVGEAREELNFSTWSALAEKDRSKMIHEIWEETSKGEMPLRSYLILHRDAKLSDEALATLREWSGISQEDGVSD
jgi:hypothetical protein